MIYSVFDGFLARQTWHGGGECDDAAFYRCLDHIIADPHFSADHMGEYFAERIASPDNSHAAEIDRLVAAAHAVRNYLVAILDDV